MDVSDILQNTNGGREIIEDLYPKSEKCFGNHSIKFSIREEKTPSCSIVCTTNGVWLVTDFGNDSKPKNAVQLYSEFHNVDFGQACLNICKEYNLNGSKPKVLKAKVSFVKRQKDEKVGHYSFDYLESPPSGWLKILGKYVTADLLKKYNVRCCKSYVYISKEWAVKTESTSEYPIFVFDYPKLKKIYQPLARAKKDRFRNIGDGTKNYVFGISQIESAYKKLQADESQDQKLDAVFLCSGERDALNMASFGYLVFWLNSETATLSFEIVNHLRDMSYYIYNIPDIDQTGVLQGRKVAEKYMDIRTIWLPQKLGMHKDARGNKLKDFTDFVKIYSLFGYNHKIDFELEKLIKKANPLKFWTVKDQKSGVSAIYNNVLAEYFLEQMGYFRIPSPIDEDDHIYVHIDGSVVEEVTPTKIANFVDDFLEKKQISVLVRNMVKRTAFLTDRYLSRLKLRNINFNNSSATMQLWFFAEKIIEITADNIAIHDNGKLDKMVMREKVIDFPKKLTLKDFHSRFLERQFLIFKNSDGEDDIDILVEDNEFLNFLINTSRMFWREELEYPFENDDEKQKYFDYHRFDIAGKNLTEAQISIQKKHLINKIFCLGYMMHRWKDPSKAWFVFGIDNKISEASESHGGSGKSILLQSLEWVLKNHFFINGRSKNASDTTFLYDGVSKNTDFVFIDDMGQQFPFQQLFSDITGKMKVNPKNVSAFTMDFTDSPKICGCSNYPPDNIDPSTQRRILYYVNSDYYHFNKNGEYLENRQVSDDFEGRNLFYSWDEAQFCKFYSFMSQCLQFFLSCRSATKDKKDPPMENVKTRELIAQMGDNFYNWAEIALNCDSGRINTDINRSLLYNEYQSQGGKKSPHGFKKSIISYCRLHGFEFNPKDIIGYQNGRIIKKVNGTASEIFHIRDPQSVKEEMPF